MSMADFLFHLSYAQAVITAFTALSLVYFAPLVIAALRGHASSLGIGISCLLFNWTGIGFIVNLVWSLSRK